MSAGREKCLRFNNFPDHLINDVLGTINSAVTLADLVKVLDIPIPERLRITLAQNIYKSRSRVGGFTDISQIIAVPGIGQKRFKQLVDALSGGKK